MLLYKFDIKQGYRSELLTSVQVLKWTSDVFISDLLLNYVPKLKTQRSAQFLCFTYLQQTPWNLFFCNSPFF